MDIVTVFHKASSPASVKVANLVKQISANAQAGATLDQASDHSAQTKPGREPFELNITEDPPTTDQVQTILGYVGAGGISKIVKGARDEKDALKRFKESKENFLRPLVSAPGMRAAELTVNQQLTVSSYRLSTGTTARLSLATTSRKSSRS